MNSELFLTFKDNITLYHFNQQRKQEIIKVSALLLAERLLFLIVLVVNYFALYTSVDKMRLVYYSIGVGIHILMLAFLKLTEYQWLCTLHGPMLILSHLIHALNTQIADDQLIAIFSQLLLIIVAVLILNLNWLITSAVIFLAFIVECLYLGLKCGQYVGVIGPQFVLLAIALSIMTYFIEKKYKSEYLQYHLNKTLKREFKHMLEVMPEAILILDPPSKQLTFANAELKRLTSKYGKKTK